MAIETFVTIRRAQLYNSKNNPLDEYIEQDVICDCDWLWPPGEVLAGKRKVVTVNGDLMTLTRFVQDSDLTPYVEQPPASMPTTPAGALPIEMDGATWVNQDEIKWVKK